MFALTFTCSHSAHAQTLKVLHSFGNGTDGQTPMAGVISDAAGNLYGTTPGGGIHREGAVFELSPKEGGGYTETMLQLNPLLKKLGFEGGLHAFRHGNATAQDRLHTPMKVRQERLGHAGSRTTMGYTHLVGDDDRRLVEQLDELFCPVDEDRKILCATVRNANNEALTPATQGFRFNELFGCGGWI